MADAMKALEHLATVKSFYLPKIPCSLPLKVHPNYLWLSKEANRWAFGFMDEFKSDKEKNLMLQWRVPLYEAMIVPIGGRPEALAFSKFMWLAVLLDDPIDNGGDDLDSLKAFLSFSYGVKSASELPDKPVIKAAVDLMPNFRSLMLPPVYNRYMQTCQKWVDSLRERSVAGTRMENTDMYIKNRRDNYLLRSVFPVLELCLGIALPDKDLESDDYISAIEAVNDHTWLVNDVLSFRKEFVAQQFTNFNCVQLLFDPNIRTLQDAINKSCAMIQEKEEEFTYYHRILTANALADNKHDLARYLDVIPHVISGNLYWHYLTARYHGMDNPCITGEPFHGKILLHPDRTIVLPTELPSHPYLVNE